MTFKEPHKNFDYSAAYATQMPIVSERGQEIVRSTKVFIGGSGGIGFNIAVAAARTGFQHITQADPQCVEIDNLNRVCAGLDHIGKKKVMVVEELLTSFGRAHTDTEFHYVALPEPLESETAQQYIRESDVIFSCANNSDSRLYLLCQAIRYRKLLLNAGFSFERSNVFTGEISIYSPSRRELACPACVSLMPGQRAGNTPLFFPALQVISGFAVMIATAYLTDFDHRQHQRPNFFQYSAYEHKLTPYLIERDPACAYCNKEE